MGDIQNPYPSLKKEAERRGFYDGLKEMVEVKAGFRCRVSGVRKN
jgi:hypothetical protein